MLAVYKAQNLSEYIRQISSSVVMVESYFNDGTGDIGSAFFVAPRILVTCAHVVGISATKQNPDLKMIIITTNDNKRFYASVLDYDTHMDAAILYVQATTQVQNYFLNLGNSGTIRPGEAIVSVGSPLGFKNSVVYGIVSNTNTGDKSFFLCDIRLNPGQSGAPLYDLDKQAVIGIASAVINANNVSSEGLSVGVAIDSVKNILKRNNIKFAYSEKDAQ